ncbi:MAG: glycosyltransferase family 9 protein [Pontibacterium sp.]
MANHTPQKILIIRWGGLGDVALCSALIEDVARHYPEAQLHFNVEPPWHHLFSADKRIYKLHVQKVRGTPKWQSLKTFLKMMRTERFDLVLDLQSNDRTRLYLSAARLAGFAPKAISGMKSVYPYGKNTGFADPNRYAFDCYASVTQALDIPRVAMHPVFSLAVESGEKARDIATEHGLVGQRFAILVPGSSAAGKQKRWGVHNYIALAEILKQSGKIDRVAIFGAGEEQAECDAIVQPLGSFAVNLCNKTPLDVIPALVSASVGMVSNDTGVGHIAAAADKPLLLICGPTLAERVKPLGQQVMSFQADPALFKQDDTAKTAMDTVEPSRVADALLNAI